MRLTSHDLRELQILKYYRLVRKWACKTYGLKDADLELLIYLDCKKSIRFYIIHHEIPQPLQCYIHTSDMLYFYHIGISIFLFSHLEIQVHHS